MSIEKVKEFFCFVCSRYKPIEFKVMATGCKRARCQACFEKSKKVAETSDARREGRNRRLQQKQKLSGDYSSLIPKEHTY